MIKTRYVSRFMNCPTLGNLRQSFYKLTDRLDDPYVHIAGGFVRDLVYKKQAKDIDITLHFGYKITPAVILLHVNEVFQCNAKLEKYGDEGVPVAGYDGDEIQAIYRIVGAPYPIDIIVTYEKQTEIEVISRYDYSINQAVLTTKNGSTAVIYNDSPVVIVDADEVKPKNKERYEYLKGKFPELDWTYVDKEFLKLNNWKKKLDPFEGAVLHVMDEAEDVFEL